MDDEDYLAVLAVLEAQLRDVGAADLTDPRHYLDRDPETGEARLPEPRKRLIEMLRAFDRFLAVRDHATYKAAMVRLERNTRGNPPRSAQVTFEDRDGPPVDLERAPDLYEVRRDLQNLVGRLLDGPSRLPPREA